MLPRSSRKCRQAREFPVTKIFVSQALGRIERAACRAHLRRSRGLSSLRKPAAFPQIESCYPNTTREIENPGRHYGRLHANIDVCPSMRTCVLTLSRRVVGGRWHVVGGGENGRQRVHSRGGPRFNASSRRGFGCLLGLSIILTH